MMNYFKNFLLVVFSVAILAPSFVGLGHILDHDEMEVCTELTSTHFHKKSLDCEVCNYRISFGKIFIPDNFEFYKPEIPSEHFNNPYQFISGYQKLSFELRGPPAYV